MSPRQTSFQAGITAGGAYTAAAGLLIQGSGRANDCPACGPPAGSGSDTIPVLICGEPERAGSHHDTRRAVAPGRRPEGRGRKPYSRRAERGLPLCVVYGGSSFVSVSSGLRGCRDGLNVTARPVQLTALNSSRTLGAGNRLSFRTLVKHSAKSARARLVSFRPSLSCALGFHGHNHGASDVGKIRNPSGEIRNVCR
jgi:hypothetical protein